jgi:hypothetical protein
MLKIKWTDRITNGGVYQRAKEERLFLKILRNRRHSCMGHIIRHTEFVVSVLEGAISGKQAVGRPRLQYLTLSRQMLHICGVSKTFGEWYQKTNKT